MNQMKVEVIALALQGQLLSRLRVTWQEEPGWFARLLGTKSTQVSAIYAGTGAVWHVLPQWRRASPAFEHQLQELERQLLSGIELESPMSRSRPVVQTADEDAESSHARPELEAASGCAIDSSAFMPCSPAVVDAAAPVLGRLLTVPTRRRPKLH